MSAGEKKLTPKQQRFVSEYLIDLNATQAAIRAGYSKRTANKQGPRLLVNAGVASAIAAGKTKREERTLVDADWVLKRLEAESEADLADLYDEKGALKAVREWPMVWRKGLVAGVETKQEFEEVDGKHVPVGLVHKVKLSERIRRVELIGKHVTVGAFAERHEHTGANGGPIETTEVKPEEHARRIAFTLAQGMHTQKPN